MEPWEQAAQSTQSQSAHLEPWEAAAQSSPNMFDRIGADYNKRANDVQNFDQFTKGGNLGPLSTLNAMGNSAGFLLKDIPSEAISSLTPSSVSQGFQRIGNAVTDNMLGRAVTNDVAPAVGQAADSLAQQFPQAARVAHAGATGANLLMVPAAVNVADSLYNAGQKAFDARRLAGIQDVVLPKQTAAEVADTALKRTTSGGLLNKQIYTPDAYEADMIKTAADAGVKPSAPLEYNIQEANKVRVGKAVQIGKSLNAINTPISQSALDSYGQHIVDNITKNKLLNPHSATVNSLLDTAQAAIDANPKTPAGLWAARKQFDSEVLNFQPGALEQDATAKAFSYTAKQIRNGMNKAIIESAPNAGVEQFLSDYTHLSNAIDNMAGKLSTQPNGRFPRFFDTKTGKALKYGAYATGGAAAAKEAIRALPSGTTENYYGGDSQ